MTIDARQLYFILENTPSEQNIMLAGKHGIGKSRILEDFYSKKNCKVVTLFLGQMSDPGDLIGLPNMNKETGKTEFMLPYWFPTDNTPVVLFLDELNRARPEVLQTVMDLTLNRKLAGKSLPQGSRIISAVNNGNEYQLTDLDPALISRFNIYEFVPSVQDWIQWATSNSIDQRIIDFIDQNPEYLDGSETDRDISSLEREPDRRSWERTSCIIKNFPVLTDELKALVTGIVGNRACAMFFRFAEESNAVTAKEIFTEEFNSVKNKLTGKTVAEMTSMTQSLFNFLESGNVKNYSQKLNSLNFCKYFDMLGENYGKELQAHFVSLCSEENYPGAMEFIATECMDLYEKIMSFLDE